MSRLQMFFGTLATGFCVAACASTVPDATGSGGIIYYGDTGGGGSCGGCVNASNGCEPGTDKLVCGKGGHACQECVFANGKGACTDGACALTACNAYWLDCDGDPSNGCETSRVEHNHCGSCSTACGPNQTCKDSFTQGGFVFECQ